MLISVRHVTRYAYAAPATYTAQSLRLTPAPHQGQRVIDWSVRVAGSGPLLEFKDGFGNTVHLATINGHHASLSIEAGGTVETTDLSGLVAGLKDPSPPRIFLRTTPQTEPNAAIIAFAASIPGKERLERLHALAAAIRDRVDYVAGVTGAATSAAAALAEGRGVCQDHAHIFVAAARTLSIPARYVTGYLVLDEPTAADAHHAWAEAWVEGLGWVGFDPANRICPTERYVRLAAGLDAATAAPVNGSRRGGDAEQLEVSVLVQQQTVQQQ